MSILPVKDSTIFQGKQNTGGMIRRSLGLAFLFNVEFRQGKFEEESLWIDLNLVAVLEKDPSGEII